MTQKTDRDTVIERALDLIRLRGYHKTTMNDVAAACGLLKGSLYHYFPGKEALAVAVMERVCETFVKHIVDIAQDEAVPVEARLEAIMDETRKYFLSREGGCIMGNVALEAIDAVPEFRPIVRKYFKDWIAALARLYESRFPAKIALRQAERIVAMIQGTIMMMRVYQDSSMFEMAISDILRDFRAAPVITTEVAFAAA
ncbi:MAG: TetR/AcrR family transcriptional regulator [Azospirillaceae bacterium]|nr:TetR/AcrR family transcriptional regulator [Azospirillaceae bacterium]